MVHPSLADKAAVLFLCFLSLALFLVHIRQCVLNKKTDGGRERERKKGEAGIGENIQGEKYSDHGSWCKPKYQNHTSLRVLKIDSGGGLQAKGLSRLKCWRQRY